MEVFLGVSVQIIAIIGFTAAVVKLLIVNPLQASINSLKDAITKMENTLSKLADEQKSIDKRLVAVEESAKSAHHRIDGVEKRIQKGDA